MSYMGLDCMDRNMNPSHWKHWAMNTRSSHRANTRRIFRRHNVARFDRKRPRTDQHTCNSGRRGSRGNFRPGYIHIVLGQSQDHQ
jgi:hypothetical protein